MTWEEYQDLCLKIASEVAAKRKFSVELAEPENDPAFIGKPIMARRWGLFRRRPKYRYIYLAFYRQDNRMPRCFKMEWFIDLNELIKLDTLTDRHNFEVLIDNSIDEFERLYRNQ